MNKSETGRNLHCRRLFTFTLLICVLYCKNKLKNRLREKASSALGPTNQNRALL